MIGLLAAASSARQCILMYQSCLHSPSKAPGCKHAWFRTVAFLLGNQQKPCVFFTNKAPQIIAGHLKMHSALAGSHINIIHPFNRASRGLCWRRRGNTGQFSARNLPNLANSVQMQEFSTCWSQCRVSEMHWLIAVSHMSVNYVLKPVSRAYCQGRKWDTLQISTNILKNLLQYVKRHELITFKQVHACPETCNSGNPGCFFVSAALLAETLFTSAAVRASAFSYKPSMKT